MSSDKNKSCIGPRISFIPAKNSARFINKSYLGVNVEMYKSREYNSDVNTTVLPGQSIMARDGASYQCRIKDALGNVSELYVPSDSCIVFEAFEKCVSMPLFP